MSSKILYPLDYGPQTSTYFSTMRALFLLLEQRKYKKYQARSFPFLDMFSLMLGNYNISGKIGKERSSDSCSGRIKHSYIFIKMHKFLKNRELVSLLCAEEQHIEKAEYATKITSPGDCIFLTTCILPSGEVIEEERTVLDKGVLTYTCTQKFKNGLRHGPFFSQDFREGREYFSFFRKGKKHGEWRTSLIGGAPISVSFFSNGRFIERFTKEGKDKEKWTLGCLKEKSLIEKTFTSWGLTEYRKLLFPPQNDKTVQVEVGVPYGNISAVYIDRFFDYDYYWDE